MPTPIQIHQAQKIIKKLAGEYQRYSSLEFDDLVQLGFEAALKAAETHQPHKGASIGTWTWIQVRGALQRAVHRRQRHDEASAVSLDEIKSDGVHLADIIPSADPPPDLCVTRRETLHAVGIALQCLATEDRQILAARYVSNMPMSAIAIALDIAPRTLRRRFRRIIDQLRAEINLLLKETENENHPGSDGGL